MAAGLFLSFDGVDGVGKTTQADMFCAWLEQLGHDVVRCRDPGGTELGESIRHILLDHRHGHITRAAEMLLYMASRAQLVDEVIRPALLAGKTVVSDRFLLANLAYQGHAGGLDVEAVRQVGQAATGGVSPHLTFLLDMDAEQAAARIGRSLDRMESQGLEFMRRVREGFLAEAARGGDRIVVIDAARDAVAVQRDVRAAAQRRFGQAVSAPASRP